MNFTQIIEAAGAVIDAVGVAVIVLGLALATVKFAFAAWLGVDEAFKQCRQNIGRAILLGLEFLVAGDIIRTVAVAPTLQNVLVLGLIVLIRTFLSFSLQVELDGRWPWSSTPERKKS